MHNRFVRATVVRRVVAASLVAMLGCAVATSVAGAHARYDRSTPASGANVAQAPTQVSITFTELLDPAGANKIAVTGPGGADVTGGAAQISTTDRHQLSVALRSGLAPGVYTVRWNNLSAEDGEEANGEFTFGIATAPPAAAPAPAAEHVEGDEHDDHDAAPRALPRTGIADGADLSGVWVLGVTLVLAGTLLRRRVARQGATHG